jgi:hypothetical protein
MYPNDDLENPSSEPDDNNNSATQHSHSHGHGSKHNHNNSGNNNDNLFLNHIVVLPHDGNSLKEHSPSSLSANKANVYRNGGNRSVIVLMIYVAYVLWAFADKLVSSPEIIKYWMMDPITKVWVTIGDPLALMLVDVMWITPNMISIFHLCLGGVSFFLVVSSNWNYRRAGALLYAIRSILDSTDGALARARAAQHHYTLSHESVVDFDFVCDTASAVMYGVAIVLYFIRHEQDLIAEMHSDYAVRVFGACLIGVFLKGFIMDMLMESYTAANVQPSTLAAFLWSISSYDSWDNLKLLSLMLITGMCVYSLSRSLSLFLCTLLTLLALHQSTTFTRSQAMPLCLGC